MLPRKRLAHVAVLSRKCLAHVCFCVPGNVRHLLTDDSSRERACVCVVVSCLTCLPTATESEPCSARVVVSCAACLPTVTGIDTVPVLAPLGRCATDSNFSPFCS